MSDNKITINPQPITPFKPAAAKNVKNEQVKQGQAFGKVLDDTLRKSGEVKFSAHALERLRQRNLSFGEDDLGRIGDAVEKARKKGVNSSLVLLGDMALVASIKNNTIITAVDTKEMKEHVFTGIDGVVIVE